MPETPVGRKWLWWVVSAVAALAVLGGGWALTTGRDGGSGDSGSGLSSGSTTGDRQTGSDGGTQTTSPASESATKPGGNATGGGGTGGSTGGRTAAKPGGGSPGPGSEAPGGVSPPAPGAPQGTFYVRIAWWNDTIKRPPTGFVLKWGSSGTWAPDSTKRSQVGTIGPFVVGSPQSFNVYVDGGDRSAGTVPFTIRPGMVSGSEQDGIHVEVRDASIFVLGNPVSNGEMTFTRP